jgi:hypothetical protein
VRADRRFETPINILAEEAATQMLAVLHGAQMLPENPGTGLAHLQGAAKAHQSPGKALARGA